MAVFLALGFRPFFFLAGFSAVILMATWVPAFLGGIAFSTYYGQIDWHSHEMIFGYTIAVVAGFLLTAVRNWTERPTPGRRLFGHHGCIVAFRQNPAIFFWNLAQLVHRLGRPLVLAGSGYWYRCAASSLR
jgi:uncharacterized protein involved in response to NO